MNTWGFLALSSLGLILLMYFFRQKYKEKEVSSNFLWEKVFINNMAQKPWQKLRKNLLLILQLLTALFLSLSLINPYVKGLSKSENYCFAIDTSLSMAALENGKTRLDTAKEEIINFLSENGEIGEITIISYSDTPEVILSESKSISEVKNAVNSVKQTYCSSDTDKLMALFGSLDENTNTVVFTDTYFKNDNKNLRFKMIGEENKDYDNIALTQISHKVNENDILSLVNIKNYSNKSQNVEVSLYTDDIIFDVQNVSLASSEEKTLDFSGIDKNTKKIYAKILEEDMLSYDNVIYDVINDSENLKAVLVSDGNVFVEKVFSLFDNISLVKAEKENIDSLGGFDIYVFDGITPSSLPNDGDIIIINPDKSNEIYTVLETVPQESGIYSTGYFENIKNIDFAIKEYKKLNFNNSFEPVLMTGNDPVVSAGKYGNNKAVIINFDIHNSDLPLKKEFPIMFNDIYTYFSDQKIQGLDNLTSGESMNPFLSSLAEEAVIKNPSGKELKLKQTEMFTDTHENGYYDVLLSLYNGKNEAYTFAVNVDAKDSDISVKYPDENNNNTVAKSIATKELQNLFLILGLLALIIEWWVNYRHEH